MKFSFINLGCPDWDLERTAEMAKAYGYDGVELRSAGDNPHLYPNPPLSHRKRIKEIFGRQGIEICCVAAYSRFASADEAELDDNRQILINDILSARDLDAKVVRSFLGEHGDMSHAEIIGRAAPYINYCCDVAHALGVTVAFETHDMWCGGGLMRLVFDHVTSPGAAILWDVGNNYLQGETVGGFYDAVGSRCAHVHLKDLEIKPDGGAQYRLPGEGTVPIDDCLNTLHRAVYDGYVTFEWEKRWHPELAEPETAFPKFIERVSKWRSTLAQF